MVLEIGKQTWSKSRVNYPTGSFPLHIRGSVIAKIVGLNVAKFPANFEQEIQMWVYEEVVNGKLLTDTINSTHENVKYLPGIRLPENIKANPDILSSVQDATLLVFVIPHQFVKGICQQIHGKIHPKARAISLIKGVDVNKKGLHLISDLIHEELNGMDVSVLMGANIAGEVAKQELSEATLGFKNAENALVFQKIFNTSYFKVSMMQDVAGVELCGALKNIVAGKTRDCMCLYFFRLVVSNCCHLISLSIPK